ncbi:TetR/AcrR family transcriptional regulator [Aldersonia kunmingensis]|uniref:TetR/AcrR family transcriptional regulator n=1 Tax=Aldersonia kunmingensis TaxID=408066 RepID=UPI00083215D8|nr:TetR/AcrR family transcriptional regulator [Aldersonia kunmingensis]
MARPAGPGRKALIEAGFTLAEEQGIGGLSVNAVTSTASMAKGSFYQHFPDRRSYLIELHRHYHDELEATVLAAVDGLDPGMARLRAGLPAFLDGCLRTRGTKALLAQARSETDLGEEVSIRNARFAALIEQDLAAIGWDPAAPVAALAVAMAADISFHELRDRRPLEDLRGALLAIVENPVSLGAYPRAL